MWSACLVQDFPAASTFGLFACPILTSVSVPCYWRGCVSRLAGLGLSQTWWQWLGPRACHCQEGQVAQPGSQPTPGGWSPILWRQLYQEGSGGLSAGLRWGALSEFLVSPGLVGSSWPMRQLFWQARKPSRAGLLFRESLVKADISYLLRR